MKKKVADGSVKKLTIPGLKEFLGSVGQPKAGKKADLVERVTEYINGL